MGFIAEKSLDKTLPYILLLFVLEKQKKRRRFICESDFPVSPWFLPSSANAGVAAVDLFDSVIPRFLQSSPIAPKIQIGKLSQEFPYVHTICK
jgi:hypothetical protein